MAWHAPTAAGPVQGPVAVPGSKSITNRALVLAALADGGGTITGALRSRDTDLMVDALRALGVPVDVADTTVTVGAHAGFAGPADIDCGLAGTVMRFVPPMAALAKGEVRFDGDPHARTRPMTTVLTALRGLGASVDGDKLPFTLHGHGALRGGAVTIDASASSQFVSALLLSGARYEQGVTVRHDGKPVPSMPHIELTVEMVRAAGAEVDASEPNTWRVAPSPLDSREWTVEPDLSNATVFLAAAAATGGRVTVPGWPASTIQAGDGIRPILAEMGCAIDLSPEGLTVTGPDRLTGVDVDMHDVSELAPTVATLAALASTPSRLRGIAHIRGHETDRLAALAAELTGLGGSVEETDDGLVITPAPLHGGTWHAYADHRMATAGALVGLVVAGVEVDDIDCTSKTMPGFQGLWADLVGSRP